MLNGTNKPTIEQTGKQILAPSETQKHTTAESKAEPDPFCCRKGGAAKKKHKRKTAKKTKGKKRRKWSKKYKDSINCKKPKGFSQRQHCLAKSKKKKSSKK